MTQLASSKITVVGHAVTSHKNYRLLSKTRRAASSAGQLLINSLIVFGCYKIIHLPRPLFTPVERSVLFSC